MSSVKEAIFETAAFIYTKHMNAAPSFLFKTRQKQVENALVSQNLTLLLERLKHWKPDPDQLRFMLH